MDVHGVRHGLGDLAGQPTTRLFEQLAATVELLGAVRLVLRQVIALADELPQLTDVELRERLAALADRAGRAAR